MSLIANVLKQLEGTSIHDILIRIEESYERIADEQGIWYKKANFLCPDGCGKCCQGFEPSVYTGEALYMAAWLLENQREKALQIAEGTFPFDNGEQTCPLFNPDSAYHCSIYGGRPFICRLFGASSFRSKNGEKMWRPCKFYPDSVLKDHNPPLQKRQYTEDETITVLGAVPPLMSDLTESSVSAEETHFIRTILPETIRCLLWIIAMNDNDTPNGSPSNTPLAA
ncbi:MAG: YkgJ family cysteine cluster protein [Treponema sp.]|nr:YkgJ family cysteine cluster protein [Treponema sp.]